MEGVFEPWGGATVMPAAAPPLRVWQRPVPLVVGALALVLVTGIAVGMFPGGDPQASPATTRFSLRLPEPQTILQAGASWLTISPDSRTLVYLAFQDGALRFFRRPLDRFEVSEIGRGGPIGTGTGSPIVSPDGRWVVYGSAGVLRQMPLLGGRGQSLANMGRRLMGASWGPGETIVLGQYGSAAPLMQVPASGGDAIPLFTPDDPQQAWYPQVLHDSSTVLFTLTEPAPDAGELRLLDLDTGQHQLLIPGAAAGRVLDSGHLVFVRSGALWAVSFDRRRLEVVGTPVPIIGVGAR